ncbi:hypothetical protein BCS96_10255 [Vibrio breoganii]|uniref:glycosyltransferase family 4 protein n=1 Tax=Vibrio breoganii TaxID=553239 RepID=UPI000C8222C9|nr:glycosyltransferase [Vibrio breoganii]PMO99173.1 hypothetical protein BCS96_10255 [Vibrio breoganii]
MKVIHIVHSLHNYSGASYQARNLFNELKRKNVTKQAYLNINSRSSFDSKNIKKSTTFEANRSVFSRVFAFLTMFFKFRPTIAHFHGVDFLLLLLCKMFGIKIYLKSTLFGSDDFESFKSSRLGFVKIKLLGLIDVNNSLTLQMKAINSKYLGSEKIVTIPNGVELSHEVTSKQKIVVIVGAVIPRKNVYEAILYFKENLQPHGYSLKIIGPYENISSESDKEYANKCLRYKENNWIDFLGLIDQNKVRSILEKATYLIHFSENEGMPNVVLEALASGVYPIVKPMNGLAKEIIVNGVTGYILYEDNFKFKVLPTPEFNVLGKNICEEKYSFDLVSELTLNVYKNLVRGASDNIN